MATTKKTTAKKAATTEVEAKVAPKTTAKTAAKVAPVEEVKVEATVVEETPAKKTTAKKTTATKTTTSKTTTAAKKTTTRKTTAKKAVEPTVDFYVEYNGVQDSYANVLENVKKSYIENNEGAEIKSIKVYLKPTENAAYCVINDEDEFRMDVFFC